jgi:hypothetical protein
MPTKITRLGRFSSFVNPFSTIPSILCGDRGENGGWPQKITVLKGREDQLSIVSSNKDANGGRSCKARGYGRVQDRYRLLATASDGLLESWNQNKMV